MVVGTTTPNSMKTTKDMTMRNLSSALLVILLGTSALAQGITTDPVTTSTSPFNAQNPIGDGVPASAPSAAAPATAPSMGFGLGKVFDEADTNRDNVVTKEEFLAKAERHFGMADSNKDGKITREEMQAQQASFSRQMQENLFGKGNNWQGKINQFLGNGTAPATNAAPVAPVVTTPTAPTVTSPTVPTVTTP